MAKISFEERPAGNEGSTLIIPDSIIEEVEESYAYLLANPDKNGVIIEDDAKTLNRWFRLAKLYGKRREDGALNIRRLPSKHLPEGHARFTIEPTQAAE